MGPPRGAANDRWTVGCGASPRGRVRARPGGGPYDAGRTFGTAPGERGETDTERVQLRLPHASEAAAKARDRVRERLATLLPPDRVDEVVLITDELVTNAVRHAQPEETGGIGLYLEITHDRVRVIVTDGSPEFEWATRNSAELAGGFGLVLVDRLADRWGLSLDGKKAVWFEVDLQPRG